MLMAAFKQPLFPCFPCREQLPLDLLPLANSILDDPSLDVLPLKQL